MAKGILSDKDIKRELGKNIFIYPFKEENLKGSTYNLTASLCAWIISDDGRKKQDNGTKKQLIINREGNIEIPPGKTALIETEESIYVSNKICGTYHSRVSLVNKGLSQVSTTLDPCYFGTSVIALHNNNEDKPVIIQKGEGIVSIIFYECYWRSSEDSCPKCISCPTNRSCKYKVVKDDRDIQQEKKGILRELEKWKKEEWRNNSYKLIQVVNNYVFNRDRERKRRKATWLCAGVGIVFLTIFILLAIWLQESDVWIKIFIALIGIDPPTTSIAIAIVRNYYSKDRDIEDNNSEE